MARRSLGHRTSGPPTATSSRQLPGAPTLVRSRITASSVSACVRAACPMGDCWLQGPFRWSLRLHSSVFPPGLVVKFERDAFLRTFGRRDTWLKGSRRWRWSVNTFWCHPGERLVGDLETSRLAASARDSTSCPRHGKAPPPRRATGAGTGPRFLISLAGESGPQVARSRAEGSQWASGRMSSATEPTYLGRCRSG